MTAANVDEAAETVLIDTLLQDELGALRVQCGGGHRDQALKSLDERGTAQELVRQQYSGRYAFELLQNANDAAVDSAGTAAVRFVVTDHSLLVANMGAPFGEEEVRAICSLGRSSKNPRKTVGYKGLGFKSVGEITMSPQIFSPPHCFGFDDERVRLLVEEISGDLPDGQHLPVYAFPLPLTAADAGADESDVEQLLAEGFVTVLRLPFRHDTSRTTVASDVVRLLRPELLLLLDATDRLEVVGTDGDFVAERAVEPGDPFDEVLLSIDGSLQQWLVWRERHDIPSRGLVAAMGGAWAQVTTVSTTVAARHDGHGTVDTGPVRPLHVYFPLDDSPGSSLLLHADFALDLDRRHIATSPEAAPYNAWLRGLLVRTAAAAAEALAVRSPTEGAVVAALNPRHVTAGAGQQLRDELDQRLTDSCIVGCVDGEVRRPKEARLLPASLGAASRPELLLELASLPCLALLQHGGGSAAGWLRELGAAVVSEPEVVTALRQPTDDVDGFYRELVAWWERAANRVAFERAVGAVPCVHDTTGSWVAPSRGVFFPRERGNVELPDDLPIAIADLPDVPRLTMLLEAAGVRRFRWRELLVEIVLPWLTAADTPDALRTRGMQVLHAYFTTDPRGDQDILERIGAVLVAARTAAGGTATFHPARTTYFSQTWTGQDDLETLYGPFGEPEFLDLEPPADAAELADQRAFLTWLGVADLPRLQTAVAETRDRYKTGALAQHPHMRQNRPVFQQWLRDAAVQTAARCDQGHPESQQLTVSHTIDRLPELLAEVDVNSATVLARVLAGNWSHYATGLTATFTCVNVTHTHPQPRNAPSLLATLLRDHAWVPAQFAGGDTVRRPTEVWRRGGDLPRTADQHLALLPAGLESRAYVQAWTDLGLVDAGRPNANELADLLRHLAAAAGDDILPPRSRLLELSTWAMHMLNGALARGGPDSHLDGRPVPLVARYGDGSVLRERPYACDDPQLTETWVDELPILADRDTATVRARFALADLEKAVTVEPEIDGPLPARAEGLREAIRVASPYLAAIALDSAPGRAATLLPRLRRLEVIACQSLTLTHILGERRKPRPATTFVRRRSQEGPRQPLIGQVYLELSTEDAEPDWFSLGPQLAQFLDAPGQRDAFSLLLNADDRTRRSFLNARGLGEAELEKWALELETTLDDLVLSALPEPGGEPEQVGAEEAPPATPDSAGDGEHSTTGSVATPAAPAPPPLLVNGLAIEDGPELPVVVPATPGARPTTGSGGPIDWDRSAATNRRTGNRGEEWAFEQERLQVAEYGFDPDKVVHWQSKIKEDSNYDIRSVDPDGHAIYIEVKATDGGDLHRPMEITNAELQLAVQQRDRYLIYRVLNTNTSTPRLVRYRDPVGRILTGRGAVKVTGAKLYLAPKPTE